MVNSLSSDSLGTLKSYICKSKTLVERNVYLFGTADIVLNEIASGEKYDH